MTGKSGARTGHGCGQDLRKLKNFRALELAGGASGAAVAFDHSGLYLAAGGGGVHVAGVKQDWSTLAQFADLPKKARRLRRSKV